MTKLSLVSFQTAILAAFDHWLDQVPDSFELELEGHRVKVTIALVEDRFNCGAPGYFMANADEAALRQWVPEHIEKNGNRGVLAPCKDGVVNVWLKGGVYVMFNFHVTLEGPC